MTKLFAGEELDTNILSPDQVIETKIENSDIPNIAEFHEGAIQVAVEAISKASNDMFIVSQLKASLESKKLSSVEYFTSIENYNLCMKSISNNLGVSIKIPSMEDFKNPYGIKASHQFVMEGFVEFMRSIWEKIKSFFKDFFKKLMLFFKRLVNANLEMEEYEQYIEGLMRKVKQSNKKDVEKITIDSKLPSLISDFSMQSMTTDYLFSKGKDKIENIGRLITYISEKCLPDLENDLKVNIREVSEKFKKGYRPLPEEARDVTSNFRHEFIDALTKNVFNHTLQLESLPEQVSSEVMNNFDREQLKDGNATFYSLMNDRDSEESLPNNFNMYFVNSNYDTGVDEDNIPTSKLLIISNINKNTHIENSMYTITNRDNLLKFYDFYKKFSKSFNIDRINNKMKNFDNTISNILKSIDEPFKVVMENVDFSPEDIPEGARIVPRPTDGSSIWAEQLHQSKLSNNNQEYDSESKLHIKSRKELEYFNRFMMNYMHCIQSFLKDFSLNIAATGQECRYEMIKLLYKSAAQFK